MRAMAKRTEVLLGRGDEQRNLATTIWSGLIVIAVVLISRRLGGYFSEGLSVPAACFVTTLLTGISLLAHLVFQLAERPSASRCASNRRGRISIGLTTLVPPFAIGIALLPDEPSGAIPYLATLFVLAATAMIAVGDPAAMRSRPTRDRVPSQKEQFSVQSPETRATPQPVLQATLDLKGHTVSQRMTRSAGHDGREQIVGTLTIHFLPGQKRAIVHLPFCPPLPEIPQAICHLLDDHPVRLKTATVQRFGMRIEARRSGSASDAESVDVGYRVFTEAAHSKAA